MKIYKFHNFILNISERRLAHGGKCLKLTPRRFDVLQLLVERAGEVVTKDQILGKVWEGQFVEEGNLPVQIAKLRKVLCKDDNDSYIETVYGVGYRFACQVKRASEKEWNSRQHGKGHVNKPVSLNNGFTFDSGDEGCDFPTVLTQMIRMPRNKILLRVELTPMLPPPPKKKDQSIVSLQEDKADFQFSKFYQCFRGVCETALSIEA